MSLPVVLILFLLGYVIINIIIFYGRKKGKAVKEVELKPCALFYRHICKFITHDQLNINIDVELQLVMLFSNRLG